MTQNDCKLAGYLGADAQLRFLPSGTPVVAMRLGQSYSYTDQNKKEVRKTNWFSVVAYGPVAEIAKGFHKGDNVILEGNLETREWEGQDKSKRRVVEVIARNIGKLERTSQVNGHDAPEGQDQGDEWPA
jgi:single-strand DNA-binding protein